MIISARLESNVFILFFVIVSVCTIFLIAIVSIVRRDILIVNRHSKSVKTV